MSLAFIKESPQGFTEGLVLEIAAMDTDKDETAFLLRRAEQEAISAIRTGHPHAAAAHFEMALIYGARAREALAGAPHLEQMTLRQR